MTARLITKIARAFMGAHASEVWAFYRDARGVYAVSEVDITKLTDAERAQYDIDVAQDAAFAAYMESCSGRDEPEEIEAPRFPTLQLAKRYAEIEDAEATIAADRSVMHAPSECYELAYSQIESRRNDVLAWAVN